MNEAKSSSQHHITPATDIESYVASARNINGVKRALLKQMADAISSRSGTVVLAGFSDYAKHLINLFGESGAVIAVADDYTASKEWTFRSVPIISIKEALSRKPDFFVCTNPEYMVEARSKITTSADYKRQQVLLFPPPNSNEGRFYDPWTHSSFYRGLKQPTISGPGSMLNEGRVQFLIENLKQSLHLSGDVLEVGVWQGGSAWPIAKLLQERAPGKRLVLCDLFEEAPRTSGESVMCEDEISDALSFHTPTEIHAGNVNEKSAPLEEGTWCFVHYDLGFNAGRLAKCFDNLQAGGVMVLDNYGNVGANPGKFDAFFANLNHEVSIASHSGQGWVVKH